MWIHRGVLRNERHSTYPSIVHAQNLREPEVAKLFEEVRTHCLIHRRERFEPQLTIATTTNNPSRGSFEESVALLGFEMQRFHVLGRDVRKWNFVCKIPLLLELLEAVRTPYFMFGDSHDVAAISLTGLIEKFERFGVPMVMNAEYAFWPNLHDFAEFNDDFPPDYITCKEREGSLAAKCVGKEMYLNSGAWIARTDFAKEVLNFCNERKFLKYRFAHSGKLCPNDQPIFRAAFMHFAPDIVLDYRSEIFQTLVGKVWLNRENRWESVVNMEEELCLI